MSSIFFSPYVGEKYTTGIAGYKTLVLGESHYCGEFKANNCSLNCGKDKNAICNSFTVNVVNQYLNYKRKNGIRFSSWMNTFTKFGNLFVKDEYSISSISEFWESVAFYNYVQSSLSGPRISPKKNQFKESEDAFFEIIDNYSPDIIIVWGNRLWNNLPNSREICNNELYNNNSNKIYFYIVKGKAIPTIRMFHPSSSKFNQSISEFGTEVFKLLGKEVR